MYNRCAWSQLCQWMWGCHYSNRKGYRGTYEGTGCGSPWVGRAVWGLACGQRHSPLTIMPSHQLNDYSYSHKDLQSNSLQCNSHMCNEAALICLLYTLSAQGPSPTWPYHIYWLCLNMRGPAEMGKSQIAWCGWSCPYGTGNPQQTCRHKHSWTHRRPRSRPTEWSHLYTTCLLHRPLSQGQAVTWWVRSSGVNPILCNHVIVGCGWLAAGREKWWGVGTTPRWCVCTTGCHTLTHTQIKYRSNIDCHRYIKLSWEHAQLNV